MSHEGKMFSLDVVLPSASLAAEAVLQAGLDLDTAEVPQSLRTELLLVTQVDEEQLNTNSQYILYIMIYIDFFILRHCFPPILVLIICSRAP